MDQLNKTYHCEWCELKFSRKYHVKRHTNEVHENIKIFKCPVCRYCAKRKDHMLKHVGKHIINNKCPICHLVYDSKNILKLHVDHHVRQILDDKNKKN